jgi:predicted RNA-binding protein YlqC (UPF0109 family)
MIDFEKTIHALIDPLVSNPSEIIIRPLPGGNDKHVTILIAANSEDTSRLIGKKGMVANALREVISVAGKTSEGTMKIRLKFESFTDGEQSEEEA